MQKNLHLFNLFKLDVKGEWNMIMSCLKACIWFEIKTLFQGESKTHTLRSFNQTLIKRMFYELIS